MISLRRLFSLACMLAICLQFVFFPQGLVSAQTPQQTLPYLTYLPMIFRSDASLNKPVINAPANGAQLTTLVPIFNWNMGTQPSGSYGCLALDIAPSPTDCFMTFSSMYTGTWERAMWFNLTPSTVYYWRIGVMSSDDDVVDMWSEERSFTTGPAGGTYPGAPILALPGSGSTVSTKQVTLSWNPVGGAKEYEVELHNKTNGYWCSYDISGTQLTLYSAYSACFSSASSSYEWSVTARNDYAWGPSSATWYFSSVASVSAQSNEMKPETIEYKLDAAGNQFYMAH